MYLNDGKVAYYGHKTCRELSSWTLHWPILSLLRAAVINLSSSQDTSYPEDPAASCRGGSESSHKKSRGTQPEAGVVARVQGYSRTRSAALVAVRNPVPIPRCKRHGGPQQDPPDIEANRRDRFDVELTFVTLGNEGGCPQINPPLKLCALADTDDSLTIPQWRGIRAP
uniref:Uncharacterized protein n=1 Tax=Vespula pensylvanica TaxID=30213 RepID=A0A834PGM5_VESPE|nr:hypothetical protein H0235_001750 [Vespula pensylvanica]